MNKQVAFLRAINVGGRRIKMDELATLFRNAGLENVQTFLASGNVVFDFRNEISSIMEEKLEQLICDQFGFESQVMIRSMEMLHVIHSFQAFSASDIEEAGALNVAFLKHEITGDSINKLMALENELDRFTVHGKEVYWLCAVKQSESKFSNAVLEKTIGIPATMRGMSTIEKLINKYS